MLKAIWISYRELIYRHGMRAIIVTLGMVVAKFLALGTAVLIANIAGAETFGEFTLFTSVFVIALTVPEQFDNTYVIFSGRKADDDKSDILVGCLIAKSLCALFVIAITFICSLLFSGLLGDQGKFTKLIQYAVVSGVLANYFNTCISYYRQRQEFASVSLRKPLTNALILFAFLANIITGENIDSDTIVTMHLAVAILLVSYTVIANRVALLTNFRAAIESVRPFIKHSMTLLLSSLLFLVANRLDVFFIAEFSTMEELGYYGVALRIAAIASMFTAVISMILLPSAPQALTSKQAFSRYLWKSVFYLGGQGLVALILIMLAGYIVNFIFIDQPPLTTMLSRLLIIQAVIFAAGTPFLSLVQSGRKPHFLIGTALLRMLLAALLMYLLVPVYGITGAAYGAIGTAIFFTLMLSTISIYQFNRSFSNTHHG